ncbi:MAG: hypothetical protein ACP5RD_09035, partial [bacterium]
MLNTYSKSTFLKREIENIENYAEKIKRELEELNKEINSLKKELERNLELEKNFREINENFQKLKKEFEDKHYPLNKNIKLLDLRTLQKFKKLLEYVEIIERRVAYETIATRIYKFNALRNILAY